ncbi:MAG: hypothetical protein A3J07_04430 [Candidatus Doudnabacteria bacterium RIFCSPLOWO2_02_FULL_49_13]|uniref:Prepilin-type N-terminal cleavage/methylation domain-containing protein n=1 Tax=Candidatus Doudnabacteria bacterium RIFCSPHIGHO2_12_FULL_48_16 TaxID=1817838 RepID=A0A1F5PJW2_9BACT|nr:MAG: hypothetical protein A3B77_03135 [Candidatus Doudnabacteria bacterium RIFCSPHIGHO2_02_FULL_49_24]OGE89113.1 MAG: hypothetical protein A2760_04070 [Candidatus Doudnabacteria bacterium RIFCSPHIGHO2_01_FULL_50_67]OGE90157.1 MAG: hypothetical protein A3E29_03570 [Candidatus Doudnabacteria bacterium RIFCSPHIGHO2_12_FULL_48_16]OGE97220.1 MAG: hypothetical protein A2990_01335 [Candidatus Doudnabacteria bacterium RIFCSPLOWO2_01_FULL_49_40]OGF03299.1 MAG: hypothetical protein A3J07_04430 [Candid
MKIKKTNRESGISLIEVVISMFILVTLLAFYTSALNTVAQSRKQRYEDLAYRVANKQMESLRATTYVSLPPSGAVSDSMLNQIPSGAGSFTVADYAGYTGIKEITVTVTWTDGIAKQLQLKTLAGNGGINP